jgi:phage gpG-like protein
MAKNTASLIKNNLGKLNKSFTKLADLELLVGVPKEHDARKEEGMNNATLAYIHDNGSPANNIPARPFMKPGIQAVRSKLNARMKLAAQHALAGTEGSGERDLHIAGLLVQSSIRNTINEGIQPALEDGTIAARKRRGRSGTKPLVDTGQLRNSITYVVKRKT